MKTNESIVKAVHTAQFLASDLRSAQKLACESNPILELHLRDLFAEAVDLRNRIEETLAAVQESEK